MMLERPRPDASKEKAKVVGPATSRVEELERRLEALGTDLNTTQTEPTEPAPVVVAAPTPVVQPKGGKDALLARIMAAQARAKEGTVMNEPPVVEPTVCPPPPFDVFEEQQKPAAQEYTPPPPFEVLEQAEAPPPFYSVEESVMQQVADQQQEAPSAPPMDDHVLEPPPVILPPPMEDEDFMFGLDADGKEMSEEEMGKLFEEQRAIMEAIQKEKADNDKTIAALTADNFESRSRQGAAPQQAAPEVAARRMEQVEEMEEREPTRTVQIGAGQHVALHGQERTKAAISAGTAILVQCMNCQNWMQVTNTATLMYCPVCSVVSPVQHQSEVMTREEALQLSQDRKMAEELQRQFNDEEEEGEETGGMASLFSGAAASATAAGHKPQTKSWWDSIFGSSSETGVPLRRGELGVSRPPSAGSSNSTRQLHSVNTGQEETMSEERNSLLMNSGGAPARVAERQPLFSCMVDSVSALGTALTSNIVKDDEEGNVHGVDASSLLVTGPSAGSGDYHQIPQD
jgi:hypothetical protein